ncbi:MAG: GNAT family N-acetyltransferase [Planctomycetota bacterium]
MWRDDTDAIGGAAVVTDWWSGGDLPGPNVWVEVRSSHRRQGAAKQLCVAAELWARELGASAIYGSHGIEQGAALDAAAALGFTEHEKASEWDLDVHLVHAECDKLVTRLEQRGRSRTESFRVHPAAEWTQKQREVVSLKHAEVLGGSPADIAVRLDPAHPNAFSGLVSTAVFDERGGLAAAALVATGRRRGEAHAMVEGLFTLPDFRLSVVTPLLQRAVASAYQKLGGRVFTMATMDRHRDTRRQAERLGPIAARHLFRPFKVLAASGDQERGSID